MNGSRPVERLASWDAETGFILSRSGSAADLDTGDPRGYGAPPLAFSRETGRRNPDSADSILRARRAGDQLMREPCGQVAVVAFGADARPAAMRAS